MDLGDSYGAIVAVIVLVGVYADAVAGRKIGIPAVIAVFFDVFGGTGQQDRDLQLVVGNHGELVVGDLLQHPEEIIRGHVVIHAASAVAAGVAPTAGKT